MNRKLADEILDFILDYFEREDFELALNTPLYDTFGVQDPDQFTDFLEDFTRKFKIKRLTLKNPKEYVTALNSEFGFQVGHLVRYLTRQPVLRVLEITPAELVSIAEGGTWPKKYYVAYDKVE